MYLSRSYVTLFIEFLRTIQYIIYIRKTTVRKICRLKNSRNSWPTYHEKFWIFYELFMSFIFCVIPVVVGNHFLLPKHRHCIPALINVNQLIISTDQLIIPTQYPSPFNVIKYNCVYITYRHI